MSRDPPSVAPTDHPAEARAEAAGAEPLSGSQEARAFWRMRRRIIRTVMRQVFSRARFRFSLVLTLSALLWLGLFWLFYDGFWFLKTTVLFPETHDETVRGVFGTFFFALMLMLVFSSGVILYGSLFRSPETEFLLTLPVRPERVFLHKFQEAVLFSSWGFVLLGSPMLLAYGILAHAPWYYYAALVPFVVAFIYIPVAIGAILCLEIIHHIPGNRLQATVVAALLLAAAVVWLAWGLLTPPQHDLLTPGWFYDIRGRLRFVEVRLLPSWWLSTGLLQASRRVWPESVSFLTLMIANALFFRQMALWIAGRVYRAAYSATCGRTPRRRRARTAWIDRLTLRLLAFLPLPARLLILKDLRTFRRDPAQWSQLMVFMGLLVIYFLYTDPFSPSVYHAAWANMVSFLNLAVVGLLMSTFTTRFVFPMVSLEGRRFWLLGLLPMRRETILWSKFLFAAGGSLLPCCVLVLLSDFMLRIPTLVVVIHQAACVMLCVGLGAIAVGLGARLPNLREPSPARIAAGFGGTLNLVVSTMYILLIVLPTALPCHFYLAAEQGSLVFGEPARMRWWIHVWFVSGVAGSLLFAVLATVIPLRIGFRAFRRLEF